MEILEAQSPLLSKDKTSWHWFVGWPLLMVYVAGRPKLGGMEFGAQLLNLTKDPDPQSHRYRELSSKNMGSSVPL